MEIPAWVDEACKLCGDEKTKMKGMGIIFQKVDELLYANKLEVCDSILYNISIEDTPNDILLSFLTTTYVAMERFTNRQRIFDGLHAKYTAEGENADSILVGLNQPLGTEERRLVDALDDLIGR